MYDLTLGHTCTCVAAEADVMTTSVLPAPMAPGSGLDDIIASGAFAACSKAAQQHVLHSLYVLKPHTS